MDPNTIVDDLLTPCSPGKGTYKVMVGSHCDLLPWVAHGFLVACFSVQGILVVDFHGPSGQSEILYLSQFFGDSHDLGLVGRLRT